MDKTKLDKIIEYHGKWLNGDSSGMRADLRVDRDLLKAFQNIAKDNNRTASQLVRDYMMNYVKKHGQGDLFK
jgi:hypothetical protein